MSELRRLPIAFKADQRSHRQLARKGCVALYGVFSNDPRQFRLILGYELIIIRTKPAHRDEKGFYHPRSEVYPTNRQFGKIAWSIPKASLPMAESFALAWSASPVEPLRCWPRHQKNNGGLPAVSLDAASATSFSPPSVQTLCHAPKTITTWH